MVKEGELKMDIFEIILVMLGLIIITVIISVNFGYHAQVDIKTDIKTDLDSCFNQCRQMYQYTLRSDVVKEQACSTQCIEAFKNGGSDNGIKS